MHAGLSRARGAIVVTMDGDLQNPPEDVPRLVEAVEAGYDVASGRRAARQDSWGRTLPSRLINGMLRRFTGVDISDFGCAFNAYRREAVEPMLGAIGRQKFTKALVLSGGATVVEVDVGQRRGRAPRATRRSASPAPRSTCSPGSGRSRSRPPGSSSATSARSRRSPSACTASSTGSARGTSPARCSSARSSSRSSASRASSSPSSASISGRIQRVVEHRPLYLVDRRALTRWASESSSPAAPGSSRRTSSGTCSSTRDHEVISLDALTYAGNLENLADVMSHPRLEFVHGDIRDAGLVREVVGGVDVIVNAAAESHVEKSILEGASEFVTTNVEGTQILLDAIRETPVERFLLVSSSEVYGTAERDPMDEEHPLNPRSPYAATKAGGDRLAYSYRITYDLPVVIVRPFNNYGPRQHPEKVVPRFITQALAGEPLTIHGDGLASRDWLHVDDTASAIEALVEAPLEQVAGEVVNVATGVDISVLDIALLVLDAVGDPDATTVHVDERPGQVDRHIGSTEKLARADRLAGVDRVRGRARADRRLVPRERGLVARRPRTRRTSPRPRRGPGPARAARGRPRHAATWR